jgi:hypothetical protein
MALYGMEDILNPLFLSESYQKVAKLSVSNPMLDYYSKPQNYDGDEVEMVVFDDDRETAPINAKGAPARTLDARGATKKKFVPVHAFNEIGESAAGDLGREILKTVLKKYRPDYFK